MASRPPPEPDKPADPDAELLVSYPAGHVIFGEGDAGREMYIVESGQVEILKRVHGLRQHRLAVLESGDFFGEMSLLEGRPRNATARCLTEARLLAIDAATFDRILRHNPEVTIRVLRSLSSRLRAFEDAEQRAREVAAGVFAGVKASKAVRTPVIPAVEAAASPAPPAAAAAPPARLRHRASGQLFPLAPGNENVIGRFDPSTGTRVDLDLQAIDPGRSLSRLHARILFRDGRFLLLEEIGTANGTWIGSDRLASGKEREIRHGDRLRLGRVDVVFELEGAGE